MLNVESRPQIHKRQVKVDFTEGVPKYWHSNDAIKTRILDSFSIQFPTIERWHISNVRASLKFIDDESVKSEAKGFIFQEGQHAALHDDYNNFIASQGIEIAEHLSINQASVDWLDKNFSLKMRVALSAGIEHFTALIAENLFEKEILNGANEKMRAAWEWHAYEEIEHRTVLFDVYKHGMKGSYLRRIFIYLFSLIFIAKNANTHLYMLLKRDGYPVNYKTKLQILKILFQKNGFMRVSFKNFLAYLKPGFNPLYMPPPNKAKSWHDGYHVNDNIFEASQTLNPPV